MMGDQSDEKGARQANAADFAIYRCSYGVGEFNVTDGQKRPRIPRGRDSRAKTYRFPWAWRPKSCGSGADCSRTQSLTGSSSTTTRTHLAFLPLAAATRAGCSPL
jgi:hypothetical protein